MSTQTRTYPDQTNLNYPLLSKSYTVLASVGAISAFEVLKLDSNSKLIKLVSGANADSEFVVAVAASATSSSDRSLECFYIGAFSSSALSFGASAQSDVALEMRRQGLYIFD